MLQYISNAVLHICNYFSGTVHQFISAIALVLQYIYVHTHQFISAIVIPIKISGKDEKLYKPCSQVADSIQVDRKRKKSMSYEVSELFYAN